MADKDLTIGIKVTADTKGAADAAKAISDAMEAANKKPFVMPIDEAGLKAREEAIRLTKEEGEAKKWLMPIDEAGLKAREEAAKLAQQEAKSVEKVVEVEKKEAAQIQQVTTAQIKSAEVQKTLTTTANAAATAKSQLSEQSRIYIREAEKAKGKTGEAAMGFMAFSNSVQDAQYGLGGVINNIPGIVSGFGLGMGVAGALQIAAVGFKILNDNFDLFGTKAKEATEEANKQAAELANLANQAYVAERASIALSDAQQKQADSLQQINGHYQEQIRLSNEIIAQKKEQADAEIASADAEAAVAMARLQLMEATGQVTKEQALIKRGQIQMEADARKQSATEAAETTKMNELRKQANAEEAKGNALRLKAKEIAEKGGGLMTEGGLKESEANVASIQQAMEASRMAQEETAKKLSDNKLLKSGMLGVGGVILNEMMIGGEKATNERKLREETAKYAEMQAALEREKAKITAHKNAVDETGVKTQDELNKMVESQVDEARKSASAASQFRGQANSTENAIVRNRGLFGLRQEAAAMTTQAGVEGERARMKQEEEKAAERKQKEVDQAASAGSSLASALSGSGASSGFVSQLNAASGAKDTDALMKLLEQLLPYMRQLDDKTRSKLEKLQSELDDLRTAK